MYSNVIDLKGGASQRFAPGRRLPSLRLWRELQLVLNELKQLRLNETLTLSRNARNQA